MVIYVYVHYVVRIACHLYINIYLLCYLLSSCRFPFWVFFSVDIESFHMISDVRQLLATLHALHRQPLSLAVGCYLYFNIESLCKICSKINLCGNITVT